MQEKEQLLFFGRIPSRHHTHTLHACFYVIVSYFVFELIPKNSSYTIVKKIMIWNNETNKKSFMKAKQLNRRFIELGKNNQHSTYQWRGEGKQEIKVGFNFAIFKQMEQREGLVEVVENKV